MKYKLKDQMFEIRWLEDCERIQRLMKRAYNLDISLSTAQWIWEDHSDTYAASWLILPGDDDIIDVLSNYVEEYDE